MLKALKEDRIGRYELLIELGRGGMAELFLGRLQGAGGFAKLVAIKRILPHLAQDKQFKDMFLNEGRIAAALSHPNVCHVYELDEVDDELYLAMEYLDGVSWDALVRELATGNFAMRLAIGVMVQACEGLHYAHTLRDVEGRPTPVIHRDVSPQNLFVTVDGICKVLDFGVSKMMTDGPRTRSGVIKGKLPYMAPEQIRGDAVDGRADVFALGVCMWEALTAQRLFDRATDFMIWKAITEEDVPSITVHWPECPPALDAVVRRALDRDREKRFTTAREFADALRAASTLLPCTPAEIAEAVRTRCSERLQERQRQVATAVSSRRVPDFDAAETMEQPSSMQIRQESVTLDLRREGSRVVHDDSESAETRDLRRDAAETRASDPAMSGKRRERRSALRMILVAIIAAAATAAIVVTVMLKRAPPVQPQPSAPPPAMPQIIINANPAPAPDATVVVEEPPPDADGKKLKKPVKTTVKKTETTTETTAEPVDPDDPGAAIRRDAEKAAEEARKSGEELRENLLKLKGELKPN